MQLTGPLAGCYTAANMLHIVWLVLQQNTDHHHEHRLVLVAPRTEDC
jgi:hypothetical protein